MSLLLPNTRESMIADGLTRAIRDDALELHVQPIMCLATDTVTGWESLLRYNHPRLGPVPPMEFIPIAERTGAILEIGSWVVDAACAWRSELGADQVVGVNISARQLMDRRFASRVLDTLDRYELTTKALCLELTETAVIDDIDHAATILQRLRERGVDIALDDFGTGYASLAVLRRLPVNIVKIDRSYVATAGGGGREDDFLAGMIDFCERLGAHVVAEGIERDPQLKAVRTFGATWGQGYFLGSPHAATSVLRSEYRVLDRHAARRPPFPNVGFAPGEDASPNARRRIRSAMASVTNRRGG